MPKYAHYDSTGHVIGWYDTDKRTYPNFSRIRPVLVVTDAQWKDRGNPNAWAVVNGELVAWTPPVTKPTLAQQAAEAMNGTITLKSKSNPALDGVFSVNTVAQSQIRAEVISLLLNGAFTNGQTTIEWFESTATPYIFTVPEFKAFASVVAAYISSLAFIVRRGTGTLPSSILDIA